MEGKKIAFIVVAIATVGGIAYYLNKRNKQLVDGLTSEVAKLPDFADVRQKDITETRVNLTLDELREKRGSSKPSTGYLKVTEG
jgi:hypothetical protein